MKGYISVIYGIVLLLGSCGNDDDSRGVVPAVLASLRGENGYSYQESLTKWNALKNNHGSSYRYKTTELSWTGFGSTTEIVVIDGQATERIYLEFNTDDRTGTRVTTDSYSEIGNELGSHEKGASPSTIDELYESCAGEYLIVDEDTNTLYFETDGDGLMTLCGFVPQGCADDCYRGISIASFDWIN